MEKFLKIVLGATNCIKVQDVQLGTVVKCAYNTIGHVTNPTSNKHPAYCNPYEPNACFLNVGIDTMGYVVDIKENPHNHLWNIRVAFPTRGVYWVQHEHLYVVMLEEEEEEPAQLV